MALTKIAVTIESDPYLGGIKIVSTANVSSISGFNKIVVKGRKALTNILDDSEWTSEKTIPISSVSNLNFQLLDVLTVSGQAYDYVVTVMVGNAQVETETFSNIEFSFDGILVSDLTTAYVAGSNFDYSSQRNTQVEYVNTLYGRFPHRISNADTNYDSGSARGLFLRISSDKKKFVPDYDHSYTKEIVDMLSNGESKILKTYDGRAWWVGIDSAITEPFNDNYTGVNTIEFNWTEIGDLPTSGMVVLS